MTPPRMIAQGLAFTYRGRGKRYGFADWSAEFPAGSVTAITGRSGSGKSTRLYLLGLILSPDAGVIAIDGEPVQDWSDAARSRLRADRFGFVFQDAALDPSRTVRDNVAETFLYRATRHTDPEARIRDLLRQAAVDLPLDRRPYQVSGGQAQRIALCRALMHDPDIVLADEPTGNLDPESGAVVLAMLREHASRGAAVVIVTHDPAVAEAADARLDLSGALV